MPPLPRVSRISRSVSASAGWLASNLTASRSRRSSVPGELGSPPPPSVFMALSSSSRSLSRTGAPVCRCSRSRASSSRSRLSDMEFSSCVRSLSRRTERATARSAAGAAAEQILPGVLAAEALALLGELHALGRERDHVRLTVHLDLALELFIELGSHFDLYLSRPSDLSASTVCGRAPTRSCRRLSPGQVPMSTPTWAPQP